MSLGDEKVKGIVYGYARVSTGKQRDEGLSIETQKERLEREYQTRWKPLGYRWGGIFIDSAVSGKKKLGERKAGAELVARVRKGDHVIMARLDRGFRRASDAMVTLDGWREGGITVQLLDFGLDSSTPTGRLLLGMLALFAEFERCLAAERTAIVMARKKKRTGLTNQYGGYGNKVVGPRNNRRIVEDPDEREAIKLIIALRDDRGLPFDQIYFQLLRLGIKARGNKEWSASRIKRVYNRAKTGLTPPPSANSE